MEKARLLPPKPNLHVASLPNLNVSDYVLMSFRNNEPLPVKDASLVSLKSPKL